MILPLLSHATKLPPAVVLSHARFLSHANYITHPTRPTTAALYRRGVAHPPHWLRKRCAMDLFACADDSTYLRALMKPRGTPPNYPSDVSLSECDANASDTVALSMGTVSVSKRARDAPATRFDNPDSPSCVQTVHLHSTCSHQKRARARRLDLDNIVVATVLPHLLAQRTLLSFLPVMQCKRVCLRLLHGNHLLSCTLSRLPDVRLLPTPHALQQCNAVRSCMIQRH